MSLEKIVNYPFLIQCSNELLLSVQYIVSLIILVSWDDEQKPLKIKYFQFTQHFKAWEIQLIKR